MIRTGIGYDVHQLSKGKKLTLGGIEIPSEFKIIGHSDGDVLIHAIVDALLGAASLGDIGKLFSSDEKKWKDISSIYFLKNACEKIVEANFKINHIDSIIILQKPIVSDFIHDMKIKISDTLSLNHSKISIKATTTDHLGYIGNSKGIASQAIATIESLI